jgi:hypothetical protein
MMKCQTYISGQESHFIVQTEHPDDISRRPLPSNSWGTVGVLNSGSWITRSLSSTETCTPCCNSESRFGLIKSALLRRMIPSAERGPNMRRRNFMAIPNAPATQLNAALWAY